MTEPLDPEPPEPAPIELRPIGPGRWWRRRIVVDRLGVVIGNDRLMWAAVAYYLYNDGLLLYAKGGRHYFLISTNYDRWTDACDRVLGELHPRFATRGDFAPFTLGEDTLACSELAGLPLGEIDRVVIAPGPILQIWRRDREPPWVSVELATVRNALLLLDQLIARGVRVESNAPLWVPGVVRHLATITSPAVGLPRAKLHRP